MRKKRIDIYGTLECPISIGSVAFIRDRYGPRRTSAVKHFITLPTGTIYIQTLNTHYWLHPPGKKIKTCAVYNGRKESM